MLLRNRSRAVTKPGLMADHSTSSQQSTNHQNYAYARTIPSLFGSPKFRDFTNKCFSSLTGTTDYSLRSPTSIIDTTKALLVSPFAFGNPFSSPHHNNKSTQKLSSENNTTTTTSSSLDSKCIGLALVGNLKDEAFFENNSDNNENYNNQPNKGNVLFGTQLKVKIPPLPPPSTFSPQTCADVGERATTTKDSQNPGMYSKDSDSQSVVGVLSLSEMELSEEYTRVISHGPNPRTTHIFNNCIVESYFSLPNTTISHSPSSSGNSFLSFCYTCKKHLDQTKDIFIYRGEKAFCSPECRHREMVLDGVENSEF